MDDEATELHDQSVNPESEGTDPPQVEQVDEEENEIVLAGQDEPQASQPKTTADYVLQRVKKRESKLQDENAQLRQQLDQVVAPQAPTVQAAPDEYAFDDRNDYLLAQAQWQRQMLEDVTSQQLNQQQNGHRIAAQEQQRNEALNTYAQNASKLKVSDFNEKQDRAFDVLGDDLARMIAQELPDDAPKIMYHLGANPAAAEKIRDEYSLNPGRTTFSLGKLAANLTVKPRQSKAAEPESKIENGSVGGLNVSSEKAHADLDKALEDGSMTLNQVLTKRRELKKQAASQA